MKKEKKTSIDIKRALSGKVEVKYNGNEKGSFKEEKKILSLKGGLWQAVKKLKGKGMMWEDEWKE